LLIKNGLVTLLGSPLIFFFDSLEGRIDHHANLPKSDAFRFMLSIKIGKVGGGDATRVR
jgi:hypothetical protein